MNRPLLSTVLALTLAGAAATTPVVAAPKTTSGAVALEGLELLCKPFILGASLADARVKARAAGWTDIGTSNMFREDDWGRVNATLTFDYCRVIVPDGSARGKEIAILDGVGKWAKAAGFTLGEARKTIVGPGPYDRLSETWTHPGGKRLRAVAYVNRRSGMLLEDVQVTIETP